jgi:hypothetical protein
MNATMNGLAPDVREMLDGETRRAACERRMLKWWYDDGHGRTLGGICFGGILFGRDRVRSWPLTTTPTPHRKATLLWLPGPVDEQKANPCRLHSDSVRTAYRSLMPGSPERGTPVEGELATHSRVAEWRDDSPRC